MATRQDIGFGAFVVGAGFADGNAMFALGDGTIRIVSGTEEKVAQAHEGAVLCAAQLADGALLTGGDDGRVAVTQADGSVRHVAEKPRKWIDHVAPGPNGAIAYGVGRQAFVVNGKGDERAFEHERAVGGLAFAPKGFRLAVARYNGVTLWWAGTEAPAASLDWKGAHIGVTFSLDGKTVVTAMQENALHGWRLADGKDMRMSGYPAKSRSLSWSAKGRFLASSGANAAILWPFHHKDGPMGRQPLQPGVREVLVTRVACHPREEKVAIGYQDGMVLLCGFESGEEALMRPEGDGPVSALAWDKRGDRLLVGTEEGAAAVVDIGAG